jgi:hypothetical protein
MSTDAAWMLYSFRVPTTAWYAEHPLAWAGPIATISVIGTPTGLTNAIAHGRTLFTGHVWGTPSADDPWDEPTMRHYKAILTYYSMNALRAFCAIHGVDTETEVNEVARNILAARYHHALPLVHMRQPFVLTACIPMLCLSHTLPALQVCCRAESPDVSSVHCCARHSHPCRHQRRPPR